MCESYGAALDVRLLDEHYLTTCVGEDTKILRKFREIIAGCFVHFYSRLYVVRKLPNFGTMIDDDCGRYCPILRMNDSMHVWPAHAETFAEDTISAATSCVELDT